MSKPFTLQKVLEEFDNKYCLTTRLSDGSILNEFVGTKENIRSFITSTMKEFGEYLIGESEQTILGTPPDIVIPKEIRNELRQEQRQKLQEFLKK